MEIKNQKEEVPFSHYVDLFSSLDVDSVCARCCVPFENGAFKVSYLYDTYFISWPKYSISSPNPSAFALSHLPTQTLLLRFLIEGKSVAGTGSFRTFAELPWGSVYVKPFDGRCLKRAAFTFGTRISAFSSAASAVGATKVETGNAGYCFEVLEGYFMQLIIWEGDDEFPPSSQILFSDNFAVGFTAEDRVVMSDLLISYLKRLMEA